MKFLRPSIWAFSSQTLVSPQSNLKLPIRTLQTFAKDKISPKGQSLTVEFGKPYKTHKCDGPKNKATSTREELLQYYKDMYLMRRCEVVCNNLYTQRQIRGFLHLYNGQEAIVVGSEAAITKEDHVITAYRDHAHFLGRGGTPRELFAELLGKVTGCSKGKGGSMHLYKKDANFHGGNGIVGAQCPIGAGVAFGLKYKELPNVCLTSYGDGAANQGQLYEAFNMAALWKLPVLFICENNKFGMGTSIERAAADTLFYTRGDYVPGLWVDAMNVLAVREAVKWAKEFALKNGPIVIEMETYRYMGHSMSDPGLTYRTREDINAVKAERDPIDKVKTWLIDSKLATDEDFRKMEKEIHVQVDEALKQAKADPLPPVLDAYKDVLYGESYYARGVELPKSQIVTQN